MLPPPPRSTLFPYTTLFRSQLVLLAVLGDDPGERGPGRRAEHHVGEPCVRVRRLDEVGELPGRAGDGNDRDRKSTRLNSSHPSISYAVFCLKKKKTRRLRRN